MMMRKYLHEFCSRHPPKVIQYLIYLTPYPTNTFSVATPKCFHSPFQLGGGWCPFMFFSCSLLILMLLFVPATAFDVPSVHVFAAAAVSIGSCSPPTAFNKNKRQNTSLRGVATANIATIFTAYPVPCLYVNPYFPDQLLWLPSAKCLSVFCQSDSLFWGKPGIFDMNTQGVNHYEEILYASTRIPIVSSEIS